MTSTGAISTDLKNAGADWVDEEFVRDGNLLTSRNPDDLPAFNEGIVSGPAVGALRYRTAASDLRPSGGRSRRPAWAR